MVISSKGAIYFFHFQEHRLFHLEPNGALRHEIGQPGNGPGEHFKPFKGCLSSDEKYLIVEYGDCKIQVFDAQTGGFVRLMSPRVPVNGLQPWDETTFFGLGGRRDHLALLFDHNGKVLHRGMKGPGFPENLPVGIKWSWVIGPDKTVYYCDGALPELWVGTPFAEEYETWNLLKPALFRKAPPKKLNPSYYFDRTRVEAYYESFTQIDAIGGLRDNHYLAVNWLLNESYPFSLDIYRLADRELVLRDFRPPGRLVATVGDKLYFITLSEGLDNDSVDRHLLHVYQFVPDKP
jgi:hypothetical protein